MNASSLERVIHDIARYLHGDPPTEEIREQTEGEST
jgi:hypothetical protein